MRSAGIQRPSTSLRALKSDDAEPGLVSRRGAMGAAAVLLLASSPSSPANAAAAAAPKCELNTAKNGLQWCDTLDGDGPAVVPKSLIRYVTWMK